MRSPLLVLALALAAGLPQVAALAEGWPAGPGGRSDPYRSFRRPADGASCCSLSDCGRASRCRTTDGRAGYRENGQCWKLPLESFVPPPVELAESPDLHVCRARTWMSGRLIEVEVHCWTGSFGL